MNTSYLNNQLKFDACYLENRGVLVTAEWDAGKWISQTDAFQYREKEYAWQLSMYAQHCDAVEQGFDNVPLVYFDYGRVAWLMALAYGANRIENNGLINAEPLYAEIDQVHDFQYVPRIWEKGLYPDILDRILEFGQRYPEIPITIPDNQSPNDVLTSLLSSEEAMVGMFTEPDAIHGMLKAITQSIIDLNRHMKEEIRCFGGFQCAKYLPFGMHVSDDNAAFLSPDTYRDFSKPYNEMLAEAFGGIAFHCCMGHEQNIHNMAQTRGFMGLDAMPDYNRKELILSEVAGRGVWNVYNYGYAIREERRLKQSDEAWLKELIDASMDKCGLIVNVYADKRDDALRLADRMKNHAARHLAGQ